MPNLAKKPAKPKNGAKAQLSLVKDERLALPPGELIFNDLIDADAALDEARKVLCDALSTLTEESDRALDHNPEFMQSLLLSLNVRLVSVRAACDSARRRAFDLSQEQT